MRGTRGRGGARDATALATNRPRVALRLPGVTAEGMGGRAALSDVIPAAGEAGEPGAIGSLGGCEAESVGGIAPVDLLRKSGEGFLALEGF